MRCRLSWLTNSALICKSKCGGGSAWASLLKRGCSLFEKVNQTNIFSSGNSRSKLSTRTCEPTSSRLRRRTRWSSGWTASASPPSYRMKTSEVFLQYFSVLSSVLHLLDNCTVYATISTTKKPQFKKNFLLFVCLFVNILVFLSMSVGCPDC